MKSILARAIDVNEKFRFLIIDSTNLIEEMNKIHSPAPTSIAALGRITTMAALLSSDLKNEKDKLNIRIKGNGPAGLLLSESNGLGHIKSYMDNPKADLPTRADGKLDVGGIVGHDGSLVVIRDYGIGEPYSGQTSLISGEIAEDFANYYYHSDQMPTVVSLGVLVDTDLSVKAAGGLFIQALPGYEDEDIDILENCLKNFPSISSLFAEKLSYEEIFEKYFKDLNIRILGTQEIEYKCNCSKEKMEKALISIGKKDLKEIIEEDHRAELVCHFCNSKYEFNEEELRELLKEAK